MPSRPIVQYPDPSLRTCAAPIDSFGEDIRQAVLDLRDTLMEVSAIGLAAPHIGVPLRIVVVRMAPDRAVEVYLNPRVVSSSTDLASFEEGSVSMPGIRETIERPARIRIAFEDVDGTSHERDAEGFEAAVLQHEIDQLDGIFWIDRLSRLKRERLVKRYEKTRRHGSGD